MPRDMNNRYRTHIVCRIVTEDPDRVLMQARDLYLDRCSGGYKKTIEFAGKPKQIVVLAVADHRLETIRDDFSAYLKARNFEFELTAKTHSQMPRWCFEKVQV